MGIFGPNYAKPGPGVEKDAPKKKGVFLYFELLGRKFFKLIQLNMLYFLCSIPYLVLMFLFFTTFLSGYIAPITEGIEDSGTAMMVIYSFFTILIFSLWGSGPASASFAYVTRCFTREEHSWIWTDFFKKFKENFKQGMILVVIDFFALFLMINAIGQYYNMYVNSSNVVWLILLYFCLIVFIIYTFLHFHIYQVMVTFECKFRELIKNSIMIAFGKAPMNLFLALFAAGLLFALFNFIPGIAVLVCFFIGVGLVRYPIEFYSSRTLSKIAVELRGDN